MNANSSEEFLGRCRCGAVEFRCSNPMMTTHCHCKDCRGWSGCAFSTNVGFPLSHFCYTKGQESVTQWTSENTTRTFCKICGTHLTTQNIASPVPAIGVARGLLSDIDTIPKAMCHLHFIEKPGWYEIATDDVSRFDHWPPIP